MTEEQLKVIEAYYNATTQGQWELEDNGFIYTRGSEHGTAWDLFEALGSADENHPNGKFVIFAHEDMPKLVAEIRHLNSVNNKRVEEYRALELENAILKKVISKALDFINENHIYACARLLSEHIKGGAS